MYLRNQNKDHRFIKCYQKKWLLLALYHSFSEQSQNNVSVNFCEHKIYAYVGIYTFILSDYEGWSSCLWKSFQVGRVGITCCALEAFCCFSISILVWRKLDLCAHLGERNLLWPFCSLVFWNMGCLESRSIYWESKWIFPRWEQLFTSSVLNQANLLRLPLNVPYVTCWHLMWLCWLSESDLQMVAART